MRQEPRALRLVGIQRIGGAGKAQDDESLEFYTRFFRQIRHVKDARRPVRYMRFETALCGAEPFEPLQFIGVEVSAVSDIPVGMTAWCLGGEEWTITGQGGPSTRTVSASPIRWDWRQESLLEGENRITGEFSVVPGGHSPGTQKLWQSANAYTDWAREIEDGDRVNLVEYDPSWPEQYSEFARWIQNRLGPGTALRIEHFGSTSVPGMPAKPIIDVAVEIPSFTEARRRVIPLLNKVEWEYWWDGGHMLWIRRDGFMGRRTHHVHMAPRDHELWQRLAFRDCLRTHPAEAHQYAELKRDLACRYRGDRERYTMAKSRFIRETTAKAIEWAYKQEPTVSL